jgi:hypothetical protein
LDAIVPATSCMAGRCERRKDRPTTCSRSSLGSCARASPFPGIGESRRRPGLRRAMSWALCGASRSDPLVVTRTSVSGNGSPALVRKRRCEHRPRIARCRPRRSVVCTGHRGMLGADIHPGARAGGRCSSGAGSSAINLARDGRAHDVARHLEDDVGETNEHEAIRPGEAALLVRAERAGQGRSEDQHHHQQELPGDRRSQGEGPA